MQSQDFTIDDLLLDLQNQRFGSVRNQRAALQEIINDQGPKFTALAASIVKRGINPMDRLLVLKERGPDAKYTVLEGNRRLAALRVLANPHHLDGLGVSPALRRRFEVLSGDFDRRRVEPIPCVVMDSREQAKPWIDQRHTGENGGEGVVEWSGLQRARFRGSDPAQEALDFVLRLGTLSPEDRQAIESRRFSITTLKRFLETTDARRRLGLEVIDKKLHLVVAPAEALKPLTRLVTDIGRKRINVTKVKLKDQQLAYLDQLPATDKPDLARSIAPQAADSFQGATSRKKQTGGVGPVDRASVARTPPALQIRDPRAAAIYKELLNLRAKDFTNAAAVLLRMFLEMSIDNYMIGNSIDTKKVDGTDKFLRNKLAEVSAHLVSTRGLSKKVFNGVVRGLTSPDSPYSIQNLNDFVHNRYSTPTAGDLKAAWNDSEVLFVEIWKY